MKATPVQVNLQVLLLVATAAVLGACGAPGERPAAGAAGRAGPGGTTTDRTGAATHAADPAVVCDTIYNSFRCARAIERIQLPRDEAAARRGDTLLLALGRRDTVRLVDQPGEGGDVVYYSYQDRWREAGYFVVQEQLYEGSEYILVRHPSGDRTRVPARPLLAPDGRRFAVLSADLVAGYRPNIVQVWRLEADRPRLEWQHEPTDWEPADGRWAGPETLTLRRACGPEETAACGTRATIRRIEGRWSLETDSDG